PLENMAEFGSSLGRCSGAIFDPERRENVNFAPSNGLFAKLRPFKPIYSRLTSWRMRQQALRLMQRWRLQTPASLYAMFRDDPEISGFVDSYYAEDFVLRRAAAARLATAQG